MKLCIPLDGITKVQDLKILAILPSLLVVEVLKRQLSTPCIKTEPITPDIFRQMILRFGLSNNLINKTMCLIGYA